MSTSLAGLARAFLAVVSAPPGTPQRVVADAMRAHPELVSGTGREDACLMRAIPGLLSKGGAEGVLAVAVPEKGAIAIKVDDGAMRALLPALLGAVPVLGLDLDLEPPAVLGGGRPVGLIRPIPGAVATKPER
jgi:L-asparaginase II